MGINENLQRRLPARKKQCKSLQLVRFEVCERVGERQMAACVFVLTIIDDRMCLIKRKLKMTWLKTTFHMCTTSRHRRRRCWWANTF